ncbi:hypothetical protein EYZ11_004592 [Aspergillus tanneri]|uniref:Uncharacterized protein n=1 Tax=Aspergillus tanneri TaxID=1220188 RepID=A0A4S3JKS6_9EURO|nr:hypothetical protein EYZ11_004592 [Aspergillus tanneri]
MELAICELRKERRDVNFRFTKIEGVDSDNWAPESGHHATCKNDRKWPDNASKDAIDIKLYLTKGGIAV